MHLLIPIQNEDFTTVQQLITDNDNIHATDRSGWTPLHWAARQGHVKIVMVLINAGANIHATNQDGITPLGIAAQIGHTEIAIALINAGANPNAADQSSGTPLHLAIYYGNTDIAVALIDKGADVNATNRFSKTPLHIAVLKGHTEIAIALINAGANPNATDQSGDTLLCLAIQQDHTQTVLALIDRGAYVHTANQSSGTPLHFAIRKNALATALAITHHSKVSYADIPLIKNNPTSAYIQHQYKRANEYISGAPNYARGLFPDMNPSPREIVMATIMIFMKGTSAKGTYTLIMKLLYNGRKLPADLIQKIGEYAGLLPNNLNLNTLMIFSDPESRRCFTEATSHSVSRISDSGVITPKSTPYFSP
jgi:ankyrin repeat protein